MHKKGGKKKFSNYRGICVTNPFIKILEKIIKNRTESDFKTSKKCGFTAGKSITDNFFTI